MFEYIQVHLKWGEGPWQVPPAKSREEMFWDWRLENIMLPFSNVYEEIDVGERAREPDDFARLPVHERVDRWYLEAIQRSFWRRYIDG